MLPGAIMGSARSTTRGEAHGSRQKAAAGAARRPRKPIEARIDILEVVERVVEGQKMKVKSTNQSRWREQRNGQGHDLELRTRV